VKGPGNCWKKVPGCKAFISGDRVDVTATEVSSQLQRWTRKARLAKTGKYGYSLVDTMLWQVEHQDDGDLHVESIGMFEDDRLFKRKRDSGWLTVDALYDWLQANLTKDAPEAPKIVGSALDQSMRTFISPTNSMAVEGHFISVVGPAKKRADDICPFFIPIHNREAADKLAIPWSVRYADVHPHPIHAALRRRQLHEIIPKFIKNSCTLVSFSPSNVSMLQQHVHFPLTVQNPLHDVKDLGRFQGDTLTTNVFTMDPIETPYAVSLDNGHYFKPGNVLQMFHTNPNLDVLILTHVYPTSALMSDKSPEPLLYTYKRFGEDMIYNPEPNGNVGDVYRQPWFNPVLMSHVLHDHHNNLVLNGGIVDSRLNSHVQVWTRYQLPGLQCMPLNMATYMSIPRVLRSQPEADLIPVEYFVRLYEYGKVVARVEKKDLWGKLRQQVNTSKYELTIVDKETLIAVVYEILREFTFPDLPSKNYTTLMGELWYKTFGHGARLKAKWFEKRYYRRYAEIICEPNPLMVIPTSVTRCNSDPSSYQELKMSVPDANSVPMMDVVKAWFLRMIPSKHNVSSTNWDFIALDDEGFITIPGEPLILPITSKTSRQTGLDAAFNAQAQRIQDVFSGTAPPSDKKYLTAIQDKSVKEAVNGTKELIPYYCVRCECESPNRVTTWSRKKLLPCVHKRGHKWRRHKNLNYFKPIVKHMTAIFEGDEEDDGLPDLDTEYSNPTDLNHSFPPTRCSSPDNPGYDSDSDSDSRMNVSTNSPLYDPSVTSIGSLSERHWDVNAWKVNREDIVDLY